MLQALVALTADPTRTWSVSELQLEVGLSAEAARHALELLAHEQVVERVPSPDGRPARVYALTPEGETRARNLVNRMFPHLITLSIVKRVLERATGEKWSLWKVRDFVNDAREPLEAERG